MEDIYRMRAEVESLLGDYVHCIDNDKLEEWPEFFIDDCDYRIIPRENADLGLPAAIILCDSKGMLIDRVVAHRKANIFPEHYMRHIVSSTRILSDAGGVILSQSNYAVFQTRIDGETKIYNTGKYVDEIVRVDGALKYRKKHCIFDTHRIDTLMVTPI